MYFTTRVYGDTTLYRRSTKRSASLSARERTKLVVFDVPAVMFTAAKDKTDKADIMV